MNVPSRNYFNSNAKNFMDWCVVCMTNIIKTRNITVALCPIRHNEHVLYRGEPIACVSYYNTMYIGILCSSRLCWTVTLQTFASQDDKIFKIKSTIKTCGGIPKMVLPVLTYG